MFSILLFMFFFFLGIIAIFIFIARRVDAHFRSLSEENAQLRVLLRAIESHLDGEDAPCGPKTEMPADDAAKDPLLHLSFEKTAPGRVNDPALELRFNPDDSPPDES